MNKIKTSNKKKALIKRFGASVVRFFTKIGIIKPSKVVLMDGGICSQILQYYQGVTIAPSFEAEFDLSFWDEGVGKDVLGNKNRPFELLSVFPKLPFTKCNKRKAIFYRRWLQVFSENATPPCYVNNYRFGCSLKGLHAIFNLDSAILPKSLVPVAQTINEEHSCGIHIRRGDLSTYDDPKYGRFSKEYILKAIDYVKKLDDDVSFFVFSDDMEWVRSNLAKKCDFSLNLVEGNMGGEDLILLANCRYIIASQGTAGRLAALINGKSLLVMQDGVPHNKGYMEVHSNFVIL